MGFFKKLSWPFRKLGKGFAWLFSRYSEEILITIEEFAAAIVLDLMTSDLPGDKKFELALQRLKERVVREGFKVYNHVLQRAIEKRVTQAHGDDLERIIDDGLAIAIKAVKIVDATDLVGDKERKNKAFELIKTEVIKQGKEWLNVPHIIHVLIQYAVSSVRAEQS